MKLYHREFGQGSPVIILHGLFGFSDNWQTVAKGLANHHLVITPDLRNHGRSPHLPSHTYLEMADDMKEFMEANWMFSASIVGHSMGGKVAMQVALSYPDLVERLVVMDIAPARAEDKHSSIFDALRGMDLSKMKSRQEAETYLSERITDVGTRQFLLKNITREHDGSYTWKMNLPALWRHFDDILAPVQNNHGTSAFDKPTLFVRGSRSDYIKDDDLPLIKTLFPQSELVTVEGAGHWVHADKPAELLGILKKFLN